MKNAAQALERLTVLAIADERIRPVFHAPRGNTKTGEIAAWNILPGVTCARCSHETCFANGCYALKNAVRAGYDPDKSNVLKAWTENTRLCITDLKGFERDMNAYLDEYDGRFFRIHAAGDFFSVEYALAWYRICLKHPRIKFLAFTKAFRVVDATPLPGLRNVQIVLSAWEGVTIPSDLRRDYPVAYCVERGEEIPENCLECPGSCETCGMCWNLTRLDTNVAFHKH